MYLVNTDQFNTDELNTDQLNTDQLNTGQVNTGAAKSRSTTHLHLTRRGRVVFTVLAAIPLIVGALAFALNGGMAVANGQVVSADLGAGVSAGTGAGSGAVVFEYVTIQSGQSLWNVAETLAPTADLRDVIAEIVSLNQLSSSAVQPGQRLALPTEYSSAHGQG